MAEPDFRHKRSEGDPSFGFHPAEPSLPLRERGHPIVGGQRSPMAIRRLVGAFRIRPERG